MFVARKTELLTDGDGNMQKNNDVEFIEEIHTYVYQGIIVPSVTTILSNTIFKGKYDGVPKYILNNKAQFGTNVHRAIETADSSDLNQIEMISYQQWIKLKERHEIAPHEQETLIHYEDLYCGTLDMIAVVNDELVINDIKTTAKLDEDYLSWQLSFYKYAYENMGGQELVKGYVTWLPKKELGQFIEIPFKTKEEVLELVQDYERTHE